MTRGQCGSMVIPHSQMPWWHTIGSWANGCQKFYLIVEDNLLGFGKKWIYVLERGTFLGQMHARQIQVRFRNDDSMLDVETPVPVNTRDPFLLIKKKMGAVFNLEVVGSECPSHYRGRSSFPEREGEGFPSQLPSMW